MRVPIPGRRSTGDGVVKRGKGGWTLWLSFGSKPILQYMDPKTGNTASMTAWRLLRARRWCVEEVARINRRQTLATSRLRGGENPHA